MIFINSYNFIIIIKIAYNNFFWLFMLSMLSINLTKLLASGYKFIIFKAPNLINQFVCLEEKNLLIKLLIKDKPFFLLLYFTLELFSWWKNTFQKIISKNNCIFLIWLKVVLLLLLVMSFFLQLILLWSNILKTIFISFLILF